MQTWTIGEPDGVCATILDYGARLVGLAVPLAGGTRDVVLRLADRAAWRDDRAYLGAVAGRYANRIAGGRFGLDGREHRLSVNDGANTLHGGAVGFDKAVWVGERDGGGVTLRHVSPDGDQCFPGRLEVSVRYAIVDGTALAIGYEATCDAATVVNLANHAYFNLAGGGDVLDHVVAIAADRFLPVDATLIPEGPPRAVAGTPFDFRGATRIGARIAADDEQLRRGRGYDHCFVLADAPSDEPRHAARVEAGGLAMTVATTEPCVQFYTANMLGPPFRRHAGLCLETQHAPDSPNRPDFPTTVLRPGQTFRSCTLYRFAAA